MEKTCIICGKKFIPAARHETIQLTCGLECRKIRNNEKTMARKQDPDIRARNQKRYYDTHKTYCVLCGKVVEHVSFMTSNAPTARMHDECVYEDCRRSLMTGYRINHVQQLRLAYRGYGVSEFVNETIAWREEHMPMSECDDVILKYVPEQFRLAVDMIRRNVDTGLYELDLRTEFKDGEFVMKRLTFQKMKHIRAYFMDVKEKRKLSSNFSELHVIM